MSRQTYRTFGLAVFIAALVTGFQNCSRVGTSAQGGSGSESSSSKSGGTTTDNPKPTINLLVASTVGTSGASAQLCLNEVSFQSRAALATEMMNALARGDQAAFTALYNQYTQSLGVSLTVLPQQNFVKTISLTPGSYTSIDLNLGGGCAFGSMSLPTAAGPLQVSEPQVLHFQGTLHSLNGGQVVLNIDPILSALAGARTSDEVKTILANVSGTF